ncbi:MAG: SoxR reducing system RseC family protein, partial [Firmicutes bacterium]|nr:SoxR reducing system RseC family protein [Bacillota bacterium]
IVGLGNFDAVTIEIPETNNARLAFVGYVLPIIPALILLFVSLVSGWREWIAILLFFVGLALGFTCVALIDRYRKHKWAESPVMISVVSVGNANDSEEA